MQVSKDGIKLSYGRFLSDTAAGFILIFLVVVWLVRSGTLDVEKSSQAYQPFLFLMAVILAVSIGISINAVSWFLFGTLIEMLVVVVAGSYYRITWYPSQSDRPSFIARIRAEGPRWKQAARVLRFLLLDWWLVQAGVNEAGPS